jgi:hypothetical protein
VKTFTSVEKYAVEAVVIPGHHISIDTPEDLLAVEATM